MIYQRLQIVKLFRFKNAMADLSRSNKNTVKRTIFNSINALSAIRKAILNEVQSVQDLQAIEIAQLLKTLKSRCMSIYLQL